VSKLATNPNNEVLQALVNLYSEEERAKTAFSLSESDIVLGRKHDCTPDGVEDLLSDVMSFPERHPGFGFELTTNGQWDSVFATVNELDEADTFIGEKDGKGIQREVSNQFSPEAEYMQLHSGSFSKRIWNAEVVRRFVQHMKENARAFFVASSPKEIDLYDGKNDMVEALLYFANEEKRGLVFNHDQRWALHFNSYTYSGGNGEYLSCGYFEENHSELDLHLIRRSHSFYSPANYYLFTGESLGRIARKSSIATSIRDYRPGTNRGNLYKCKHAMDCEGFSQAD